ncbi:MAG: serine hydrolase [Chitinophagaceae bacterium]|nr:serine hydrolase [Chitinophagaceae bacterium]
MRKTILPVFFLFTISSMAQHQSKQLDSLFKKLHQEKRFNGNVLVAEKGNVIYKASLGNASLVPAVSLNDESLFELASVSKQFTAMGIMLLKKDGRLSYEDSLRKFFPQLPYSNIAIRHLLNHTSGLPDYMGLFAQYWDTSRIATNADIIHMLAEHKPSPLFKPGEKWEYSNTGYALLASIIEKASGTGFGDFLAAKIFQPLGMKRTVVYRRRFEKRKIDNYAYGYVRDATGDGFVLPDDLEATAKTVYCLDGIMGDGTVNSTTGDLLKWDQALYSEKIVSKEMLQEAFSPAKLNNGTTCNYGFGWAVEQHPKIGKVLSHGGSWPGYMTFIERHPETGKTIIILGNHETEPMPVQKVINILYGWKEKEVKEIQLSAEVLKQYEGEYQLTPDFSITISAKEGRTYAQATGQPRFEIFAESEDLFFLKVVEAKIRFKRNEKKEVTSLILFQNGQETEGQRIK